MGWLWASTSTSAPPPPPALPADQHTNDPSSFPNQISDENPAQSIPSEPAPLPQPQDDPTEAELSAFLSSLETPSSDAPSSSTPASRLLTVAGFHPHPHSQDPSQALPSSSSSSSSRRITPHTPHPSTLSCRQSFDQAFYCQSLGGQFNAVYRTGGLRSCSDNWAQFWFCMRTNRGFMSQPEREETVREWFRKREGRWYGDYGDWVVAGGESGGGGAGMQGTRKKRGGERGKGSTAVWEERREMLEGSMSGDWEEVERWEREERGREEEEERMVR